MNQKYIKTLLVLGWLTSAFNIVAPIHEMFHWLAAILSGVPASIIGWSRIAIYGRATLFIGFAGMTGEVLLVTAIFYLAIRKEHRTFANYLYGYNLGYLTVITSHIIKEEYILDVSMMIKDNPGTDVMSYYYVWFFLYLVLMAILGEKLYSENKRKITSLYGKRAIKNLNNYENALKTEQKTYKPLTLVK